MASYHQSNFGAFGGSLPVDLDGYTYTTGKEWLDARLDVVTREQLDEDAEYAQEWAEQTAAEARKAIDEAQAGVQAWREIN